jgi:aspartyl-tRNA synthetase
MKNNLILRHKIVNAAHKYLNEQEYLEVETPMLTKSTPEGARDYLVPSRVYPGSFYALPQSPQLFKQLLMVSGFEKYYQVVKCFRDEDLRADRQPEFTQIDIEASFVTQEDIMELINGLLKNIFTAVGKKITEIETITYQDAMLKYGNDRPDLRFGMEFVDISDVAASSELQVFKTMVDKGGEVKGINVKNGSEVLSRKELDDLKGFVGNYGAKGLAWITIKGENDYSSPIIKFFSDEQVKEILTRFKGEPGDVILFVADKSEVVAQALGELRNEIGRKLKLYKDEDISLVWVVNFPLFEKGDDGEPTPKHHPFTAPDRDDLSDPFAANSLAYDIVFNGVEIGGGSVRIHDKEMQEKIFGALKIDKAEAEEKFGFLLSGLQYGAPPHAGIALGLDRLAMLLCGANSIREVIAFPKTQNAGCPLTNAPSQVSEKQLDELHLKVELPEE